MNTNVLKKCLEELGKETPRLDYLRGMIETLVEMQGAVTKNEPATIGIPADYFETTKVDLNKIPDEASMLDNKARVGLGKIKKGEMIGGPVEL